MMALFSGKWIRKKNIHWPAVFSGLLILSCNLNAQYYESGQDPASLKWKKIESSHFKVIYPESFASEGQRLTNLLEYAYSLVSHSLDHKPKKIPVIVHNYSVESNGFVAWAPKRIEMYPVPLADSYPQDELEQLVLHELRHVVQMDKLNRGFSKGLFFGLGEQAIGGISVMLPLWFLEGDAVAAETNLSLAGRGRYPQFSMLLRALALEKGGQFKYDKSLFGSYKDYTPSRYDFGYQMVANAVNNYSYKIWRDALDNTGKKPYTLNPVNFSLRSYDRLTKKKLYDLTFSDLRKKWMSQDQDITRSAFDTINKKPRKAYTSYRFPQYINDHTLLVEKSGIDQVQQLVLLHKNGREEVVHTPGFYYPSRLSYSNDQVVWVEQIPDARWSNRRYSVIKKLNLTTRKETAFAWETRYFSPDLSDDGTKIAVIDIDFENKCTLRILDTGSGASLRSFSIPGNNSLHMPEWAGDQHVLLVVISDQGKSIRRVNIETGAWEILLEPGYDDIRSVISYDQDFVLFHSSYSGIDNIYALNTHTGEVFQVTSSRFGIFDPALAPDRSRIAVTDFTSDGYNVVEYPLNKKSWKPVDAVTNGFVKVYKGNLPEEQGILYSDSIPGIDYEEKPFRKWKNIFGFHSWMPFYFDYENFTIQDLPVTLGVTLLSQNKLSTAVSSVGYSYRDQEHHLITRFTYKGWYPVFDFYWDYGGAPYIFRDSLQIPLPSTQYYNSTFNTEIYIPLNLTRNRYVRGLYPSLTVRYRNAHLYNGETGMYDLGRWLLNSRLYFYNYTKMARRDIKPRFGQTIDLNYTNAPLNTYHYGTKASVMTGLYLPGIGKHHSIYLRGGWEKQNPKKFLYFNTLPFPRGYSNQVAEKLFVFRGEYFLPLFYPEINFGSLLYIPRFHASVFYDYARGEENYNFNTNTKISGLLNYASLGGKLNMDFNILRFPFPFTLGFQYSYIPEFQSSDIAFTFAISFYGFTINRTGSRIPKGMLK